MAGYADGAAWLDERVVKEIAALPAVREAAQVGARLMGLWPLQDARHLDNDAAYAETLQVRVCRNVAGALSGRRISMADAEFIYEGADAIPGRDQAVVDALLAVIDAYDAMAAYSATGDVETVMSALRSMDVPWSDEAWHSLDAVLHEVEIAVGEVRGRDGNVHDDGARIAGRLALVALALGAAARAVVPHREVEDARRVRAETENGQSDDGSAVAPLNGMGAGVRASFALLPYANGLCERLAIPGIVVADAQWGHVVACADKGCAVADVLAAASQAEWRRHYEDVLWDRDEAKRIARQEDERRSKEALAARFSHVEERRNEGTTGQ